ncbi:anhydro-N-acetylmuramic acid kinase [Neptuniibacter caesariensis]|uniref:Anhydro-N-acetylmuramic acid kinase n=1 Tax=Neptuniibacter caesariensis TaxID=207954 RepID=A0A7U8GR48_NEPCE|nr:anhydro-N-acetylmuramic acid kinase [Neptuniibacter caesariensis]EAR59848.1 hypothetical protein MED92_17435 [Oceanospirillum sp. MED92] [Neptuniibacter caesariensis]
MTANIYIGLMSGTSLDGIDAVAVRFTPDCHIIASHSEPFPSDLKQQILRLTQPGDREIDLMGQIDIQLGELFSHSVMQLLQKNGLKAESIAAIGSHGQTIRHRPEHGFTLQIGDPNIIAERTGITTIADFRRRDMAAAGQGAPLVPAFHQAMLHNPDMDRVLLNIGGMANITHLPQDPTKAISGFDTGPGNILLDAWINEIKGLPFDKDGAWASSGKINSALLNDLLSLDYFQEAPPKSTGREQFNLAWLQNTLATHQDIANKDVQRTLLELTAATIADALNKYVNCDQYDLFVCGGGSRNHQLTQRIQDLLPNVVMQTSDKAGIDADWMEAAAFAWLAKCCLGGSCGNAPSVTGAKGNRILGAIYQA